MCIYIYMFNHLNYDRNYEINDLLKEYRISRGEEREREKRNLFKISHAI